MRGRRLLEGRLLRRLHSHCRGRKLVTLAAAWRPARRLPAQAFAPLARPSVRAHCCESPSWPAAPAPPEALPCRAGPARLAQPPCAHARHAPGVSKCSAGGGGWEQPGESSEVRAAG
eukprot:351140-Chlamydomonas_euryale.AAC.5